MKQERGTEEIQVIHNKITHHLLADSQPIPQQHGQRERLGLQKHLNT